ncbi:tyrosine-protein phosphatase [Acidobacteriota bacterium]
MNKPGHSLPTESFANHDVNEEIEREKPRYNAISETDESRTKKKPILVKIFVIVLFFLIVIGGFIGYWELTNKFIAVHKGNLYRSAEIHSNRLLKLSQKHGIRTVIDLRIEKDKAQIEKGLLKTIGVKHVHIPSGQIPTMEAVEAFIKIMDDPQNRPALIHCIHGVGRTGIFSAIYRIEYQGWTHSKALFEAMLLAGFSSFRSNSDKAKFISDYKPR